MATSTERIEHLEGRIRTRAVSVADRLRSVADRIERISKNDKVNTIPDQVMHELLWGLANTNADVVSVAYADLVAARSES